MVRLQNKYKENEDRVNAMTSHLKNVRNELLHTQVRAGLILTVALSRDTDCKGSKFVVEMVANATMFSHLLPVSRFECVSGLSVYPVEIRSVNNLSSSEDC